MTYLKSKKRRFGRVASLPFMIALALSMSSPVQASCTNGLNLTDILDSAEGQLPHLQITNAHRNDIPVFEADLEGEGIPQGFGKQALDAWKQVAQRTGATFRQDQFFTMAINARPTRDASGMESTKFRVAIWPTSDDPNAIVGYPFLNRRGGHHQLARLITEKDGGNASGHWVGGGVKLDADGNITQIFAKSGLNGRIAGLNGPDDVTLVDDEKAAFDAVVSELLNTSS